MMTHRNPMLDANVKSAAERFSNLLCLDLLEVLLNERILAANHRVIIPRWSELCSDYFIENFKSIKPLHTIFGVVPIQDIVDASKLYHKLRTFHLGNIKPASVL